MLYSNNIQFQAINMSLADYIVIRNNTVIYIYMEVCL